MTESRKVDARVWGEENGELVFNRYRVSVLQDTENYGDGRW